MCYDIIIECMVVILYIQLSLCQYLLHTNDDCIGETPKELCGMVRSMKKNSKPVELPGFKCLDIVGKRYR